MPPPVAQRIELRLAKALSVRDRDVRHLQPAPRRLQDHLRRQLHAVGAEVQSVERVTRERPQPALAVADPEPGEQLQQERDRGRAHVAVAPRHGARRDAPGEAVADRHVVTLGQRLEQAAEVAEVVGIVAVAHHEPVAARLGESAAQRRSVASPGLVHDARPRRRGDVGRAVDRPVVNDHHLARGAGPFQPVLRLPDAHADRLLLVQARHDDGDERRRRVACACPLLLVEPGIDGRQLQHPYRLERLHAPRRNARPPENAAAASTILRRSSRRQWPGRRRVRHCGEPTTPATLPAMLVRGPRARTHARPWSR